MHGWEVAVGRPRAVRARACEPTAREAEGFVVRPHHPASPAGCILKLL